MDANFYIFRVNLYIIRGYQVCNIYVFIFIYIIFIYISELFLKLESQENNDYQTFETNFVDTLNNQAPKKSKIFRGNQKPHINKILRNAIMKRSQLKKKQIKLSQ